MPKTQDAKKVAVEVVQDSMPPVKFNLTDAALTELKNKHELVESKDYKDLTQGIAECRNMRVGIETHRKELKKDSLDYGRKVDAEAKRITASIEEVEQPMKAAKAKIDAEKEREREAKRVQEDQRIDRHKQGIAHIQYMPVERIGSGIMKIEETIEVLQNKDTSSEIFEEFHLEATEAKVQAIQKLRELIFSENRKLEAEKELRIAEAKREEEADKAAEIQRIEAYRLKVEQDQLAKERKEHEDAVRTQREEAQAIHDEKEAKAKALRDEEKAKMDAERNRLADVQAKLDEQKAEQDAKDQAEAEKKEAEKALKAEKALAKLRSAKDKAALPELNTLSDFGLNIEKVIADLDLLNIPLVEERKSEVRDLLVAAQVATQKF